MSSLLIRSRLLSHISKRGRRLLSSDVASNTPKEPLFAAETLASNKTPPTPPPSPQDAAVKSAPTRKAWNFFKYSIIAALTGATASVGYVSYAYSLEHIEEKTKSLREALTSIETQDDASAFDKFKTMLYSSAITVPAKAAEVYLDARRQIEEQVRGYTEPYAEKLLPDLHPLEKHVYTLVLDLQETLLYTYWTREKGWQTIKRPGVDAFLEHLTQFYEIVVYSDHSTMYLDPVMERLDPKVCYVRYKLGKAATKYLDGVHYRDLSKLNRDPRRVIYLSAHARENSLQPENGAVIKPYKSELNDTALLDFIPFLEFVARNPPEDVRQVLASYEGHEIPAEFIRRSKEHQRKMQQKQQGRLWNVKTR